MNVSFSSLLATLCLLVFAPGLRAADNIEPGPESRGLRMQLHVEPRGDSTNGFNVRVDLINTTERDITLYAAWRNENDQGGVKEYIEAATSIVTYPEIAPWVGQVGVNPRKSPQPSHVLKGGETLSVNWQTDRPRLKNKVSDANAVQNPEFPFPGLYSVHATLKLNEGDGRPPDPVKLPPSAPNDGGLFAAFLQEPRVNLFLRSNEQLVPVGGSREMPRHTYGQLWSVDPQKSTATFSLGSLHGVEKGDAFELRTGMHDFWKLTITSVSTDHSRGLIEPLIKGTHGSSQRAEFPKPMLHGKLIIP